MQLNVPGVILDGTTPATASLARADLVVYQSTDTVIQVTVTGANGTAFNLTGYTATLTVKDRLLPTSGTPQWNKTYSGTLTNPTGGVVQFTIPATDLKAMLLQGYWWDVFVTSGAGKKDPVVLASTLTVNATPGA